MLCRTPAAGMSRSPAANRNGLIGVCVSARDIVMRAPIAVRYDRRSRAEAMKVSRVEGGWLDMVWGPVGLRQYRSIRAALKAVRDSPSSKAGIKRCWFSLTIASKAVAKAEHARRNEVKAENRRLVFMLLSNIRDRCRPKANSQSPAGRKRIWFGWVPTASAASIDRRNGVEVMKILVVGMVLGPVGLMVGI